MGFWVMEKKCLWNFLDYFYWAVDVDQCVECIVCMHVDLIPSTENKTTQKPVVSDKTNGKKRNNQRIMFLKRAI